jgi:hypothetical protein
VKLLDMVQPAVALRALEKPATQFGSANEAPPVICDHWEPVE